jgi:hypothetical protein
MYLGCAQRFAAHHHQPPTALGEAEVRAFPDADARARAHVSEARALPALRHPFDRRS